MRALISIIEALLPPGSRIEFAEWDGVGMHFELNMHAELTETTRTRIIEQTKGDGVDVVPDTRGRALRLRFRSPGWEWGRIGALIAIIKALLPPGSTVEFAEWDGVGMHLELNTHAELPETTPTRIIEQTRGLGVDVHFSVDRQKGVGGA